MAVVVDYFERFTARFPSVAALSEASEDDVLSLWSGLGYYSRGRNLHRAAQAVMQEHGGVFPSTSAGLAALPGVGPYTAAAVASLAFGERTAVVDGNVARVIARVCDDGWPVDDAAGRARVLSRAQALVDATAGEPGEVNEGLMELGATVCTPRSPRCGECPWRSSCKSLAKGTVDARPIKAAKKARKAMRFASVVIVDAKNGNRVWLEKRAERGLFGGLWAPPSRTVTSADEVRDGWRALLADRGIEVPREMPKPVVVERTLTHRDLTFYVARVKASSAVNANGAWFDDVTSVGTSTAVRAVLAAVAANVHVPPGTSPGAPRWAR